MIVYFADRNLNIQGSASTTLPASIRISADTKTDSIETGTKTFSCSLIVDNLTRLSLQEWCKVGNFILRSTDDENEFYQIIETSLDALQDEFTIYAEDAGLDLLNTVVPAYTATTGHGMEWYINYYLTTYAPDWAIGLKEVPSRALTLEWDAEATLTERLLSIATNFDCEIAFSYKVEGMAVTNKYVDIYSERGNKIAQNNYYINREVADIVTKQSIANLATAYEVTGGTLKGKSTPINLSGANYSSDGTTTHSPAVASDDYQIQGTKVVCKSAMAKWASDLDQDGLLVRSYSYDTTNKQELFSHAVAELKKVINGETTYDVTFNEMPDIRTGDRINIIDDQDEIYIEARVLKLETSATDDTKTAELGEYVLKRAGISERLQDLANRARNEALSATTITISSSNGLSFHNQAIATTLTATVIYGDTVITNQSDLEDIFGVGVAVKWYHNGTLVGSGFTYTVTSANNAETYSAKVEV